LTPTDLERESKVLHRKIENGADFALSQPVYNVAAVRAFVQRYEAEYGPLKLHLLAGVLPLYNARHAEFLHNEVPGINIPEETRRRIRSAGSNGADEGLAIARELIAELRGLAQGIYLMPPFERFDLAAELIETVKQDEGTV